MKWSCWLMVAGLLTQTMATAADREPDVVLTGSLTRAHHQTYLALPFEVPSGVDRLTVRFDYDRSGRTTVDLGLEDPTRFRGWSGGNKDEFFLSETAATPSYLPGPLPAGRWRLILGVPNLREEVSADYRAEIYFATGRQAFTQALAATPLLGRPGWYRGDLHAHSAHSDGHCASQRGERVPCPVYRTVESAAARGLDFVALTEHNARSQHQSLLELQAVFDQTVLLVGREITTFHGHFNVFGTTAPIDFRESATNLDGVLQQAVLQGGLVSINHPGLPSGESCMGCGWSAGTNLDHVSAVEVVNGGAVRAADGAVYGALSGIPFWERLLDQGRRLTAVAGSDNHDPALAGTTPTTVVHALELSQNALLDGLRAGRVFIDVAGTSDREIDIEARSTSAAAAMGGTLDAPEGADVQVIVTVKHVPDATIRLIHNATAVTPDHSRPAASGGVRAVHHLTSDGRPGWLRAEALDVSGRVLLLTNPVYLNH